MKVTQTQWKTGALPAPEPNQVLLVRNNTTKEDKVYYLTTCKQFWNSYGDILGNGNIPSVKIDDNTISLQDNNDNIIFLEWSIITYKRENEKEPVCPNCGSTDFDVTNDEGEHMYTDSENYTTECKACHTEFHVYVDVDISFTVNGIIENDEDLDEEEND
jgi:hypothetical protein